MENTLRVEEKGNERVAKAVQTRTGRKFVEGTNLNNVSFDAELKKAIKKHKGGGFLQKTSVAIKNEPQKFVDPREMGANVSSTPPRPPRPLHFTVKKVNRGGLNEPSTQEHKPENPREMGANVTNASPPPPPPPNILEEFSQERAGKNIVRDTESTGSVSFDAELRGAITGHRDGTFLRQTQGPLSPEARGVLGQDNMLFSEIREFDRERKLSHVDVEKAQQERQKEQQQAHDNDPRNRVLKQIETFDRNILKHVTTRDRSAVTPTNKITLHPPTSSVVTTNVPLPQLVSPQAPEHPVQAQGANPPPTAAPPGDGLIRTEEYNIKVSGLFDRNLPDPEFNKALDALDREYGQGIYLGVSPHFHEELSALEDQLRTNRITKEEYERLKSELYKKYNIEDKQ